MVEAQYLHWPQVGQSRQLQPGFPVAGSGFRGQPDGLGRLAWGAQGLSLPWPGADDDGVGSGVQRQRLVLLGLYGTTVSIVTGAPPRVHGICGNYFYDTEQGTEALTLSARAHGACRLGGAGAQGGRGHGQEQAACLAWPWSRGWSSRASCRRSSNPGVK